MYWQLDSYHEQAARDEGKDVVRINMDETAIDTVMQQMLNPDGTRVLTKEDMFVDSPACGGA